MANMRESQATIETPPIENWRKTDLPVEVRAKAAAIDEIFKERKYPFQEIESPEPGRWHGIAQITAKLYTPQAVLSSKKREKKDGRKSIFRQ